MRHRRRRHGLTETLWGLKLDRSVNALYQCAWSLSFGGDGRILNAYKKLRKNESQVRLRHGGC